MLKRFRCVAILIATCAPIYAQTGPTGTWRVETGDQSGWEVFLRADGPQLAGLVNYCASELPGLADIYDTNVAGATVTFKCDSPDGDRTIALTGRITGDEITFTWQRRVWSGGLDNPAVDTRFGPSASPQFTAKRVPDGELAEAADRVRGMELSGAVNLLAKDARAEGRLFVPQKVRRVRGLLVAIRYGLGFQLFEDTQLPKLSETLQFALLSVWFSDIGPNIQQGIFAVPGDGLEDAFASLLERFARESGHQELMDAPLLFWGHSSGGRVAARFAVRFPQRTLGFVRYHSGANPGGELSVQSKIPALFVAGAKDTVAAGADSSLWKSGRAVNAPWTYAIDPDAPHGDEEDLRYLKKANQLMIPWVAAVVRARLSPDGRALRSITDGSGWLGNNQTGEFAPYGTFSGSKVEASWLPDEASARAWRTVWGK